jgi:phytoene/squalene synthetase
MDIYLYLSKIADAMDGVQEAEQINALLDELDRIQNMLDPEFQDAVDPLIQRLNEKLNSLD